MRQSARITQATRTETDHVWTSLWHRHLPVHRHRGGPVWSRTQTCAVAARVRPVTTVPMASCASWPPRAVAPERRSAWRSVRIEETIAGNSVPISIDASRSGAVA